MKKIIVNIIKLILVTILINIVTNFIVNFAHIEVTELISYILFLIKHAIIIYIGINFFWKDLELEDVKKITIIFMIIIIVYNIFYVLKSISDYEQSLSLDFSSQQMQYDDSLSENQRRKLNEFTETVRKAGENIQKYLEENKDEYYSQLIRVYIFIDNIIAIIIYLLIVPKMFTKELEKRNHTFDFYNDYK